MELVGLNFPLQVNLFLFLWLARLIPHHPLARQNLSSVHFKRETHRWRSSLTVTSFFCWAWEKRTRGKKNAWNAWHHTPTQFAWYLAHIHMPNHTPTQFACYLAHYVPNHTPTQFAWYLAHYVPNHTPTQFACDWAQSCVPRSMRTSLAYTFYILWWWED